MATTTNFGWETPDDTDLVKDGAAAMRTLGNGIDTSFVDLKGGTTGQVLSKTSNTDLDFTWVTSDDANAIQNAIVDAKGDLIAASAADTPARLAVGNNGETLVADSSTSTGLRYQTGVNLNGVINGGMDIWQRGTSFAIPSSAYTYTADRWIGLRFSTGSTVSQQTASLDGFQYSIRVQRDSGNTGTGIIYLGYNLETADSYRYAGKTVTFSFYAKAGANYSAASSALKVILTSGTGTNQKQMDGFTGASNIVDTNATLTTSWQRFTYTASVASNVTQLGFQFYTTPVGTASTNDWFEITGVQIELGSVATNFKRAGGTLAGELAACQRYYWRATANGAYSYFGWALATSTSGAACIISLPATLRVAPTSVDYSNVSLYDGSTNTAITSLAIDWPTNNQVGLGAGVAGTPLTVSRSYRLLANNNSAAYIGVSSEL